MNKRSGIAALALVFGGSLVYVAGYIERDYTSAREAKEQQQQMLKVQDRVELKDIESLRAEFGCDGQGPANSHDSACVTLDFRKDDIKSGHTIGAPPG